MGRVRYFDWQGNEVEPPKSDIIHITNADKIRAMPDEELASFLWNRDMDIVEKASKAVGFTFRADKEQCLLNVLDWLREEVTE